MITARATLQRLAAQHGNFSVIQRPVVWLGHLRFGQVLTRRPLVLFRCYRRHANSASAPIPWD